MMRALEQLRELKFYAQLSDDDLRMLGAQGAWREEASGATLMEAGAPARSAWLVVSGRLSVRSGGQEVNAAWPGDIIGESALFGRVQRRNATVVAVADSVMLRIDEPLLDALHGGPVHTALQRHLIEVLVRRIRSTDLAIRRAWRDGQVPPPPSQAPPEPSPWRRLVALLGTP
jgi:CRP-like cAMP-binding protein